MRTKFRHILFITVIIFSSMNSNAQQEKYKSALIYQFTRLIEWNNKNSEFTIGVVGISKLTPYLYKLAEIKTVKGKAIIIKEWSNIFDIGDCDILFLSSSNKNQLQDAIEKVQHHNAILITENEGFAEKGSGINFIIERNSVRYETNISRINLTGHTGSKNLTRMAWKNY